MTFPKIQKWLTLRREGLRVGLHCAESESAQSNTARSQNLCRLTLRGVLPASFYLCRPLHAFKAELRIRIRIQRIRIILLDPDLDP